MDSILSRSIIKETTLEWAVCLAVLATLPILAMFAIALRGAVLIAIVGSAVLCALLYPMSGRFREWFRVRAEIEFRHRGLRLARDVLLYPAHSWARWNKNTVTVGADDLLLSAVGPVEAVDFPALGSHASQGDPLFRIRRGERVVDVLSPVSGSVCESNEVLKVYPELMNESPFTLGWVVRLSPDEANLDRDSLLASRRARAWFQSEVDCAIDLASSGAAATDGSLHRCIDSVVWDYLSQMFKQRQSRTDSNFQITK